MGTAAATPRGRLRARRLQGPALRLALPRRGGRAGHPAPAPRPAGGRAEHRGPRRRGLHAGGADRAAACWPATSRWPSRTPRSTARRRWYAGLLATLYEIGKETASILDLDELLHRVAEIVKRVIDYEMFGILLLDEAARRAGAAQVGALRRRRGARRASSMSEGLCGAAALQQGADPGGRRAQGPALPAADPRHALGAGGAARPQGPGGGRVRPRVVARSTASPRSTSRCSRRWPARWRWPSRTRASYDELGRKEERLDRELAIARGVQHGLFPEECPVGAGLGGLGPLPARAGAGRRPLRLLRPGRGPARPRRGRRGGQGRAGGALRRLRLGHGARARLREATGRPTS